MKSAVVLLPGLNRDRDMIAALTKISGKAPVTVWQTDTEIPDVDLIAIPGGFSFGDYLRCGAIARFAPVMEGVTRFADAGGLVLGICNGFQILCEAGLLPGVLRLNRQQEFVCRDVELTVERSTTPFTAGCVEGDRLTIPVKHGEGNWFADAALHAEVERRGQVVLRYAEDVNGALGRIAGLVNEPANVMGLMPHPEHAVDPLLGPTGGVPILAGLVAAATERAPLLV